MTLPSKKVMFIVAGAVGVCLLGGVGFKLYSGISKFDDAEKTLSDSMRSLKRSYAAKPFPSVSNVTKEKQNVESLETWFGELMTALRKGQVHPDKEKRPSKFMRLLEDKRKNLDTMGAEKDPNPMIEGAMLGFAKYLEEDSELPAPDDVPRLTQQLLIIENVCSLMIDANVASIDEISRDVFEERAVKDRRKKKGVVNVSKAGLIEGDALSATFHFVITFTALEDAFWKVLNDLSAHDMFVVVTDLNLAKDPDDVVLPESKTDAKSDKKKGGKKDKKKPATASPLAALAAANVPKEDQTTQQKLAMARRRRVVSGAKVELPMKVTLGFDVYWFRPEEGK